MVSSYSSLKIFHILMFVLLSNHIYVYVKVVKSNGYLQIDTLTKLKVNYRQRLISVRILFNVAPLSTV